MKTAISIPDPVFKAAEQLAKRLGKSRSSLYTEAISSYVYEHQNEGITEKLNEIYSKEEEEHSIDPDLVELQLQSITEEKW
ncbi:MAG: hypothetical protein R6U89_02470 [Dehalococcoidia bacterium]